MKASKIKIGHSIQELFFLIAPPGHIRSDVSVLKDDVQYLIGHEFEDRFTKAHIALFRFDLEEHFDDITRHVEEIANGFSPFNVFVKNLKSFEHGSRRTIFLDIVNKYPIREMFEKLVKKDVQFTPHIAIARNLEEKDFRNAWPYLKDLDYNQHFVCDRITVLARTDKNWIHYQDIPFAD